VTGPNESTLITYRHPGYPPKVAVLNDNIQRGTSPMSRTAAYSAGTLPRRRRRNEGAGSLAGVAVGGCDPAYSHKVGRQRGDWDAGGMAASFQARLMPPPASRAEKPCVRRNLQLAAGAPRTGTERAGRWSTRKLDNPPPRRLGFVHRPPALMQRVPRPAARPRSRPQRCASKGRLLADTANSRGTAAWCQPARWAAVRGMASRPSRAAASPVPSSAARQTGAR
jgi:hypothetical protein